MFEFLLDKFFGFNYDAIAVLIGVPLVLFTILLIIHICIFAKMLHEKISDPKGFKHRSLEIFPIFTGLILSIILTSFLSILMMWNIGQSNLQKESLANDTVSTHYKINKVGNNLVFQRKRTIKKDLDFYLGFFFTIQQHQDSLISSFLFLLASEHNV